MTSQSCFEGFQRRSFCTKTDEKKEKKSEFQNAAYPELPYIHTAKKIATFLEPMHRHYQKNDCDLWKCDIQKHQKKGDKGTSPDYKEWIQKYR